jgi:hypothetical protein
MAGSTWGNVGGAVGSLVAVDIMADTIKGMMPRKPRRRRKGRKSKNRRKAKK